jgi:SAM-dependent methyltransferase
MTSLDAVEKAPVGPVEPVASPVTDVPGYMREIYDWAYLNPRNVRILDREVIVSLILWGNNKRLKRALFDEIAPAATVLQAAHVYGSLIPEIAAKLDHSSQLEVVDVSALQAGLCRAKLLEYPGAVVRVCDIARLHPRAVDVVSCFFLLHEIPRDYKRAVVNILLDHIAPGGKAVFVDYHRPAWYHPLRGIMSMIWRRFEPFALDLLETEIELLADDSSAYTWSKQTCFGGLYQKVVVTRRQASHA